MNAETRAKEIVDAENQFCEEHSLFVRGDTLDRLEAAITQALRQAEREARVQTLTSVRDAIDRSDSANDYPAWKSEALIVDMINALILLEKD